MALDKIYSYTSPNISDSKITLPLLTSKICEVDHSTIVITSGINQSTVVFNQAPFISKSVISYHCVLK